MLKKSYIKWILFWQQFGFYSQHAIIGNDQIAIFTKDTKFTDLNSAAKDLKATCNKIQKRSKSWSKKNAQIKKKLSRARLVLK